MNEETPEYLKLEEDHWTRYKEHCPCRRRKFGAIIYCIPTDKECSFRNCPFRYWALDN